MKSISKWKRNLLRVFAGIFTFCLIIFVAMQVSTYGHVEEIRKNKLESYLVKDGWTIEITQLFTWHDFFYGKLWLQHKYTPGENSRLPGPENCVTVSLICRENGEWNTMDVMGIEEPQ